MGRKPRAAKATAAPVTGVAGILTALKFCESATKEIGQPNQTHFRLSGQWAVAFDGVVAMGHKTDTDIQANPHARTLIKALSKCVDTTQITQLGDGRLSVKSGRFQTFVPCLPPDLLAPVTPDPPCAHINDAVVNALIMVAQIAKENADRIMLASVLLRANTAVATDGHVIMEAWHGIDLPTTTVPKTFIMALMKIGKSPVYFGFSASSVTFYFEDGSWIRTQVYTERWPDVDALLNQQTSQWSIPAGLWEGLERIIDLTDDTNQVHFGLKSVRTNRSTDVGAICEIEGSLPEGLAFNIDNLYMMRYAKTVDFQAGIKRQMAVFYSDKFRAALAHVVFQTPNTGVDLDKDIPL